MKGMKSRKKEVSKTDGIQHFRFTESGGKSKLSLSVHPIHPLPILQGDSNCGL